MHCIDVDGNVVAQFCAVVEAAKWWYENGYCNNHVVKDYKALSNVIKKSSKEDKYIEGLKWIYD